MARERSTASVSFDPVVAALAALFDDLDGIQSWVKDRDGRYAWVNRGFLLNYAFDRPEQVLGRTDHDLSPVHLADQYRTDDELVLGGEAIDDRMELVGGFDRTARWSRTTKRPLRDRTGRIVGTVGMTRVVDPAVVATDVPSAVLGRVLAHVRTHFAEPVDNAALAAVAGRSVRAIERLFQRHLGVTPQHYLRRLRVRLACRALVHGAASLTAVAHAHGFYDQSHFVREFRRETGLTPGAYRVRYAGTPVASTAVSRRCKRSSRS